MSARGILLGAHQLWLRVRVRVWAGRGRRVLGVGTWDAADLALPLGTGGGCREGAGGLAKLGVLGGSRSCE